MSDTFDDIDADDTTESEVTVSNDNAPLPDGIYFGLPMARYIADRALSGSAFKLLLTDPAGLYWDTTDNPFFIPPTKSSTRHMLRGSASHCLLFEGDAAYLETYEVEPEGMLTSFDDCKEWMRKKKAEVIQALGRNLGRDEGKPYLLGDDHEELVGRILALDPAAPIWKPRVAKEFQLAAIDDTFCRLAVQFLRSDPEYKKYLENGFGEVTFVLTIEGVRYKCRFDYLNRFGGLDGKSYGRPPRLGRDLKGHVLDLANANGADLQATHNMDLLAMARERCLAGDLCIVGGTPANAVALQEMFKAQEAEEDYSWRWLYYRMGGGLTSIMIPFRESDAMTLARSDIERAVDVYRHMRETCGDGMWMVSAGVQEIDDGDLRGRMAGTAY